MHQETTAPAEASQRAVRARVRQLIAPVAVVARGGLARRQYVLLMCCLLHSIHDGFTSAMYLLLPLIATDLRLSYAQVGLLKTLLSGGQSLFQLPGGMVAERLGERRMLALGLATLAAAFLLLSSAGAFVVVAMFCLLIGIGASLQHPLSSSLVSRAYEERGRRTAMGTYNFAGDVGKVAFPALLSGLILVVGWHASVKLLGAVGLAAALLVWVAGKARQQAECPTPGETVQMPQRRGWGILDRKRFAGLVAVGVLDESGRTVLLTFVPFLLAQKGATPEQLGLLFTLVFAGGACGKFVCGPLAERFGPIPMVVGTELLTGLAILALIPLPLTAALALLPLLGVVLNGTSSVLYATVADLVSPEARARGYGLFYMLYQGAGMVAPVLYGWFSDAAGLSWAMILLGLLTMGAAPMAVFLRERPAPISP
jgi:MFS transporter, FSR family, fosmidomycin resistance protein